MFTAEKSHPAEDQVVENTALNRFEIHLGGHVAVAEYQVEGDRMLFTHTGVPAEFRGRGIAEKLVLAGFRTARERRLKIVPVCSYVAAVLQRHPEFRNEGEP
ncbi:MAG: GNAT family N-acetyltransferase [Terrimicrobiaceae bacterium]